MERRIRRGLTDQYGVNNIRELTEVVSCPWTAQRPPPLVCRWRRIRRCCLQRTVRSTLPAGSLALTYCLSVNDGLGSLVTGDITISSSPSTPGVMVNVNFRGFPSETMYGPFVYHIHNLPVPADGNCTATMGHLDPTNRGEYYPCNAADPASCQVGDLSGKYGNITASDFVVSYADSFLSTDPSSPAYFGDKSVVIHTSNVTRITCANFMMMGSGMNGTMTGNGTMGNGTSPTGPAYSGPVQTGAASSVMYGGAAIGAAVVGFLL